MPLRHNSSNPKQSKAKQWEAISYDRHWVAITAVHSADPLQIWRAAAAPQANLIMRKLNS